MEVVVGGLAGVIAVVAMNPLDLVKIRMQLQGEGATRGSHQRPYRNTFHALYTIAKTEGFLALERGLVAAGLLGFFNNGTRLGLYKIADNKGWNRKEGGEVCFWKAVMWSSFSGGASGILTNPMIIVKTRLQSMSKANRLRVGKAKYNYTGMIDAYRQIYKREGIWNGFYCGAKATGIRLAVGSAAQLTTFSTAKEFLYYRGICQENKFGLAFLASLLCSVVNSLAVCPLDVCTIRLYNQGQKKIYNGIIDCLYKIVAVEGFHGLYKGLGPLYIRLAPVTTISLVAWDLLNHLLLPFSRKV